MLLFLGGGRVLLLGFTFFSFKDIVVVVQSLSCVQPFATPWTAAHQVPLSFTISLSLLKLMSTESVILSNYLILCHPLLLLPSILPSIRVFSNESVLQSGNQSIGAAALVADFFFRIDWFGLLESP